MWSCHIRCAAALLLLLYPHSVAGQTRPLPAPVPLFDRWAAATDLLIETHDLVSVLDLAGTGLPRQRQMEANRFAAAKLKAASRVFSNTDTATDADNAMRRTIAQLQVFIDRHFQVLQESVTDERTERGAELQAREALAHANIEKAWQAWPQNTRLVCNALTAPVPDGSPGGGQRLTQAEREAIRQRLQQRFPSPGTAAAGQDPLRASIGVLKQCLSGR